MAYVFSNLDDIALAELGMAVHAERRRRSIAKLAANPPEKPEWKGSTVETIKAYREKTGVDLLEAHEIVRYFYG